MLRLRELKKHSQYKYKDYSEEAPIFMKQMLY